MPKISTYTNASPITGADLLIGTDANASNMTKNFLLSDLSAYFNTQNTLDTILAAGNTSATESIFLTSGGIHTGSVSVFNGGAVVNNYLSLGGAISDINGDYGYSDDILTSTGTTVIWKSISRGSFYSTVSQAALAINTGYAMTLNNTDTAVSSGVSVVSGSRMTVATAGVYNIQFSAQLDRVSGSGTDTVDIWFRKNGVDIANSNTKVTMTGNANACKVAASWNFITDMVVNDYVEIMWSTTSTNIQIIYEAASAPHPATPSVIATIVKIV